MAKLEIEGLSLLQRHDMEMAARKAGLFVEDHTSKFIATGDNRQVMDLLATRIAPAGASKEAQ